MTAFTEVEETLLLVAEARERAERASRAVSAEGGPTHVTRALEAADRELLAIHRRLMEGTLFRVGVSDSQLELDAA